MKRTGSILLMIALAVVSVVRAQTSSARLRTSTGEVPITVVEQIGQLFVPADAMSEALGGSLTGDPQGYRVALGARTAGFTSGSRFGAVGDELIEMPTAPIFIDARPFLPWEFFRELIFHATPELELRWDPAARLFVLAPRRLDAIPASISVVALDGMTKIVIELSREIPYTLRRDPAAYVIQFRNPLTGTADRGYEEPFLDRVSVQERQVIIALESRDVAGDSYTLQNPFRVVIDLQKGERVPDGQLPLPGSLREPASAGIRTIVLDPGHGGKEVGAVGPGGLVEKGATLAICRRLQSILGSTLGVRVLLTREDDSVVPLDERTALANQYSADLFLSVHLNASRTPQAHGAETYYLSLDASDELARATAERENAMDSSAGGAASRSDLNLILWDLAQQKYLKESSRLAELVQEEMNSASGVENRGVKQAPFKVLIGATMPAALVEVGFISNPEEESKLASAEYQDVIARALARAITKFKAEHEAHLGLPAERSTAAGTPAAAPASGAQ
ncbi:MAG TPA: N-acetylmuramoyl-L-alanine amidase [Thermoanaerobaculia bacterium]|nr:N-acetylmuramoyl-L-alanine amidase [Thermoanaerobaculia bacterium]